MIHSCNPYFIALSQKLSAATLFQTAEKLGYGTEIPLTDSMSADGGILPTLQDLKISAEKANFCFGQGMLTASPLQVARMTCAIANGGTLPQPRLIRGITKDGVSLVTETETTATPALSPNTATALQELMIAAAYGSDTFRMGLPLEQKPPRHKQGDMMKTGWNTATAGLQAFSLHPNHAMW